jgi:hypothetical protein
VVSLVAISLLERGRHREGMPPAWVFGVGAAALLLMVADGLTSYAGLRETSNLLRLATGLGVGFALPLIVVPAIASNLWSDTGPGRILGDTWSGPAWLAAYPAALATLVWVAPSLGAGYALLTAACVVATFATVNLIAVSALRRFQDSVSRLRDAWPALLIALGLTVLELVVAGWLRLALSSIAQQR